MKGRSGQGHGRIAARLSVPDHLSLPACPKPRPEVRRRRYPHRCDPLAIHTSDLGLRYHCAWDGSGEHAAFLATVSPVACGIGSGRSRTCSPAHTSTRSVAFADNCGVPQPEARQRLLPLAGSQAPPVLPLNFAPLKWAGVVTPRPYRFRCILSCDTRLTTVRNARSWRHSHRRYQRSRIAPSKTAAASRIHHGGWTPVRFSRSISRAYRCGSRR